MNTIRWCVAVCVVALAAASTSTAVDKKEPRLPTAVATALEKAGELELYSLDGDLKQNGEWHGAKVLGKTTVKGADAKKVATGLAKGVADGDSGAKCFIPRHGVRVTHDKKTYDLVICFECHWVYVYTDADDKPQRFATTGAAEKAINELLTAAKVPLAKPEK